jgi:hypothetical protein
MRIHIAIERAQFSAAEAATIAGTSRPTLTLYVERDLIAPCGARPSRFHPDDVLDAMILRLLSGAGVATSDNLALARRVGFVARAILPTLPGALQIEADPALGPDFIERERARLSELADAAMASAYVFAPAGFADDQTPATVYERSCPDDLDELLDNRRCMGQLVDCLGVAQAFLDRVRRITDRPLEIRRYAPEGARAA